MKLVATSVTKTFGRRSAAPAVDSVSLSVEPGDFTAIVGESGSGKSTLARILLGLLTPDSGDVTFDGTPLTGMTAEERRIFRSSVQCVLQDPSAALNPRKTVGAIVGDVIRLHRRAVGRSAVRALVLEVLSDVGLTPPEAFTQRLPHQLSGGQRQRVLIARAIVLEPSIIIADEAVSALDVSVKAGILRLLGRLREERGIGYLFITHDLPVVKKVADHVYVMKDGRVVEHAPQRDLFSAPTSDYTRELLAASPEPDPRSARYWLRGAPTEPAAPRAM